jgi:hypothetical protein
MPGRRRSPVLGATAVGSEKRTDDPDEDDAIREGAERNRFGEL